MSKVEEIRNLLYAYEFNLINLEQLNQRLPQILNLPKDTKDEQNTRPINSGDYK